MLNNCTTCLRSVNCGTEGNQCIDYEPGSKKEIKKNAEEIKNTIDSMGNIASHEEQDKEFREKYYQNGITKIPNRD